MAKNVIRYAHSWRWSLQLLWEPRDLWVGIYWTNIPDDTEFHVYICIVPCLPIRFVYDYWRWPRREKDRG